MKTSLEHTLLRWSESDVHTAQTARPVTEYRTNLKKIKKQTGNSNSLTPSGTSTLSQLAPGNPVKHKADRAACSVDRRRQEMVVLLSRASQSPWRSNRCEEPGVHCTACNGNKLGRLFASRSLGNPEMFAPFFLARSIRTCNEKQAEQPTYTRRPQSVCIGNKLHPALVLQVLVKPA